jgi:hypothetical protein
MCLEFRVHSDLEGKTILLSSYFEFVATSGGITSVKLTGSVDYRFYRRGIIIVKEALA